jgi:hypothetical protein
MHIQDNDTTSATSQNYILLTVKTGCVKIREHLGLTPYEYQKNINQYCRYVSCISNDSEYLRSAFLTNAG